MKEATGEVSMTVITLVAIGVIGAILALFWPQISNRINRLWNTEGSCPQGQFWNGTNCQNISQND